MSLIGAKAETCSTMSWVQGEEKQQAQTKHVKLFPHHQPTKTFGPHLRPSHHFSLFVIKQGIFLEMSWKVDTRMGKRKKFLTLIFSLFDCWKSKDKWLSRAVWKAVIYSELIKKESPTVLNYSNVLFISSLFKPKDIQYIVYSTGKLHKWSLFKYLYGVSSFRY